MKHEAEDPKSVSRAITFLTREELDFIDKISKDSLYTTGMKLPRTKVLEAIVGACMKTGISGENVHSKEELMNKIFEEIAKRAIKDMTGGQR